MLSIAKLIKISTPLHPSQVLEFKMFSLHYLCFLKALSHDSAHV